MNTALTIGSSVSALLLGLLIGEHSASNTAPAPTLQEDAAPQAPEEMSEAEMMAAWMKAGTPGDHHRFLDAFVGRWNANMSMWMSPDDEPTKATGVMTTEWILDGRFLEQDYEGDFMGTPFTGKSLFGYDNAAQTFRGLWIDSMSTHFMESAGYVSEDGKSWTMYSNATDPVTGGVHEGKEEYTIVGPDEHHMKSWMKVGDDWVPSMEIVYTRAE